MIDSRSVIKSLRKKGFKRADSHHVYLHHQHEGRLTGAYTYVSQGANETLGEDIISMMRVQLKLSSMKQVRDLVQCPLSEEAYVGILRQAGVI